MISVLELRYQIVNNNLVVRYVIHIRKPKVSPIIGKVTIKLINDTNPEFSDLSYIFTIENPKMTRDTLVKRSHVVGMIPNCDKICLIVEDSYGYVSDCAFIKVGACEEQSAAAMFYCGKIKLKFNLNLSTTAKVSIDELNGGLRTNKLTTTANADYIAPWILFYKDSSYIITVNDSACLVLHTEGYTTAPSTYLSFNYSVPAKVQLIKFKVTHIQSDRIYFAFLNFAGGYQGIQATHDKRINGCKNILISSQWNDHDMPANIIASNERNLDEIFGGEGTGVKSMMDYDWKPDTDYYMAVHADVNPDGQTIDIARYVRNCTDDAWTFISVTRSKHYGKMLGNSVSSFLEAWTNESIQEGTFYQRAVIYGGWVMDDKYQWIKDISNIEVAATNSILDPNNDLFSAGYDTTMGTSAFYYSHGYNKITGDISIPAPECKPGIIAYDDSDEENTGKYARRYFLDKSKLSAAPTISELVPSSRLVVTAVNIESKVVRVSVDTDIPYYKIEHKIGDQTTVHNTKNVDIPFIEAKTIVTTVYGIFGQNTTVTNIIQIISTLQLQATFTVSNVYLTWSNAVPMGIYRLKLSNGTKTIFDSDFTIMGNTHVIQFVETRDNTIIVKDNKHIYVKSWNEIVTLQNNVKNKLIRASISGKSPSGVITPTVFAVLNTPVNG